MAPNAALSSGGMPTVGVGIPTVGGVAHPGAGAGRGRGSALLALPTEVLRQLLRALPTVDDRLALRAASARLAEDVFGDFWKEEALAEFGCRRKPAATTWRQHYYALRARRCLGCGRKLDMCSGRVVTVPRGATDGWTAMVTCVACGPMVCTAGVTDPVLRARLGLPAAGGTRRYRVGNHVEWVRSQLETEARCGEMLGALSETFGSSGEHIVCGEHPLLIDYACSGPATRGASPFEVVQRVACDHWLRCYTRYGGDAVALAVQGQGQGQGQGRTMAGSAEAADAAMREAAAAAAGGWPAAGRWPWLAGSLPTVEEAAVMADRVIAPYGENRLLGLFWLRWTSTADFAWLPHTEWFVRLAELATARGGGGCERFRVPVPHPMAVGLIASAVATQTMRVTVTRKSVWFRPKCWGGAAPP